MNIVRNEKVMLVKEMDNFQKVGEVFEVANITDTAVVLRDASNKIAVGVVNIDCFDEYFKKPEDVNGWTPWQRLTANEDVVAFYRAKGKKIQVRLADGTRSEANCNDCDEFNLFFGIQLAYERCLNKIYKQMEKDYEKALKEVRAEISECHHRVKTMINTMYKIEEGE